MAPRKFHSDELKLAFALYLEHNGQRHDLIEKEMHRQGWTAFRAECIKSKGLGTNYREGLADKYGWNEALKIKIATAGTVAATSAESLLAEVENIRKLIYLELEVTGVGKAGKDLIYQHDKYVQRSTEILAKLERARDNYANFVTFFKHLIKGSMQISPALAKELSEAEDALIEWAESEFVIEDERPKEQ